MHTFRVFFQILAFQPSCLHVLGQIHPKHFNYLFSGQSWPLYPSSDFFIMLPRQTLKSYYKSLSVLIATLRTFFLCLFGTQIHWSVPAMDRSCALWDHNCKFTLPMIMKRYLLYFFTCVWPQCEHMTVLFAPKRDLKIPCFDESLIMNNWAWRCWSSSLIFWDFLLPQKTNFLKKKKKKIHVWSLLFYRRVSHGLGWPANAIFFFYKRIPEKPFLPCRSSTIMR